jgi:O-antigen/teichoic acid export membrane protein
LIGARATALMQQISVPTYATLQRDRLGVVRVFDLQMGLVGVVYIPLAVVIAALAPLIVPFLFGPQWISTVSALRIFCLYAVCAGYASIMASLHYGAGRPDLQMKSWAGQCALYAVMIVPMTLEFGIIGAAMSLTTSYVLGIVLQGIGTRQLLGPSADATFWLLGRTGLVVGLLAGGLLLIARMQTGTAIPWMLASACAAWGGLFGWYLWRIEVPRLKALWKYQSQGAGA